MNFCEVPFKLSAVPPFMKRLHVQSNVVQNAGSIPFTNTQKLIRERGASGTRLR